MDLIVSNQNPIVKEIKSLKQKKFRDEKRLFFIEGERFVEEAVKEKDAMDKVIISDKYLLNSKNNILIKTIEEQKVPIYQISDKLFIEISDTENPQGILAVIKMKNYFLEEALTKKSFIIILDSIQDPGNMGTIIRSADASGATGIIYSKGCVDIYNPKVLRGTMGSVFHLPIIYSENLVETIRLIKKRKVKIFAAHLEAEKYYFNMEMKDSVAIVIGNEANGITEEISSFADHYVKIPMVGKSESLNASVAAGVLMYEVVRQRMDL